MWWLELNNMFEYYETYDILIGMDHGQYHTYILPISDRNRISSRHKSSDQSSVLGYLGDLSLLNYCTVTPLTPKKGHLEFEPTAQIQ